MQTSKQIVNKFNALAKDERGFCTFSINSCEPDFISQVNAWRKQAKSVTFPFGTDLHDATEVWTFEDSSSVQVDNPHQAWGALNICEL